MLFIVSCHSCWKEEKNREIVRECELRRAHVQCTEREQMRVRERWMVCRKSQVYRLLVVLIAVAVAVVGLAVLALQPYDVRRQIVLRYYISGAQSNFYCGTFATTAVSLIITVTTTTTRGAVTATITDLALLGAAGKVSPVRNVFPARWRFRLHAVDLSISLTWWPYLSHSQSAGDAQ